MTRKPYVAKPPPKKFAANRTIKRVPKGTFGKPVPPSKGSDTLPKGGGDFGMPSGGGVYKRRPRVPTKKQAARKVVRQATRKATRGGTPGTNVLKTGGKKVQRAVKVLGTQGARKTAQRTKKRLAATPRVGPPKRIKPPIRRMY